MIRFVWVGLSGLLVLPLTFARTAEAQPYGAIAYDDKTGSWGRVIQRAVAKPRERPRTR
jgi:hypothetical protein